MEVPARLHELTDWPMYLLFVNIIKCLNFGTSQTINFHFPQIEGFEWSNI